MEDMYENIFLGSLQNLYPLKGYRANWTDQVFAKNLEKLVIEAENIGCSKRIKSLLALPTVSNTTVVVSLESDAGIEYWVEFIYTHLICFPQYFVNVLRYIILLFMVINTFNCGCPSLLPYLNPLFHSLFFLYPYLEVILT